MIPFNKPYFSGKELDYIRLSIFEGKISGDGPYTRKCHDFFMANQGFKKALLTTSCTDALEMSAILANIQPGDEVIMPAYTFVSTANAFVLRGAKVIFIDSRKDHPGMDEQAIEKHLSPKTKAIIPVHYAGVACQMDLILNIAKENSLFVIEDAAQAIESFFINNKNVKLRLGSIGDMGAFSFHETKNIISGEGGLLTVNNEQFSKRAEIIREKGTNRSSFFRGEVDKYGWVDMGSSFLPSDIIAAYLFAQLEAIDIIQQKRLHIWDNYSKAFSGVLDERYGVQLPFIPNYATNNGHMYYLVCKTLEERNKLIAYLKSKGILAVFHYLSLNKSQFYKEQNDQDLFYSDYYSDRLVRLPLFYELTETQQELIISEVLHFYKEL